eukprot:9479621-Pyramimonas_sp.AAC.1
MAPTAGRSWVQCEKCGPRSWTSIASSKQWCHRCGLYYEKPNNSNTQRSGFGRKGGGKDDGGNGGVGGARQP